MTYGDEERLVRGRDLRETCGRLARDLWETCARLARDLWETCLIACREVLAQRATLTELHLDEQSLPVAPARREGSRRRTRAVGTRASAARAAADPATRGARGG